MTGMISDMSSGGRDVDYFLTLNEDCKRYILSYLPAYQTVVQVMQMYERRELRLLFHLGRYLLNQEKHHDCTTLYVAAKQGLTGLVRRLCSFPNIKINQGSLIFSFSERIADCTNIVTHSILIYVSAIFEGHTETALMLIKAGANVNHVNPDATMPDASHNTPFLLAVLRGNATVVTALMEHHCDVSVKNQLGFTALMIAARNRDLKMVMLLLTDINVVALINNTKLSYGDAKKITALDIAADEGHTDICITLLAAGAYDQPANAIVFSSLTASTVGEREGMVNGKDRYLLSHTHTLYDDCTNTTVLSISCSLSL